MQDPVSDANSQVGLVDPALEASALPEQQDRQHPRTSSQPARGVEILSVHLSRPSKTASWGFLIYSNIFPLRVGAITSNMALQIEKDDEILSINKMTPEDYDDALRLLQHARLNLELRLQRVCGQRKRQRALQSSETTKSITSGVDSETPLSTRDENSPSSPPYSPPTRRAALGMIFPPPLKESPLYTRGVVRQSAQIMLDTVLQSERRGNGEEKDLTDPPIGISVDCTPSSPAVTSATLAENVTEAWRSVLSRKRNHASRLNDGSNLVDVGAILSKPTRQVIYDRLSCPFSEEEGFTPAFHKAVQYTMTQRALLHGRDTDALKDKGASVLSYRNGSSCKAVALASEIIAKTRRSSEEVQKYHESNELLQNKKELEMLHSVMLRMAAAYHASSEEKRRIELEKYSRMEHAAQEFFSVYTEATLLVGNTMANSKSQSRGKYFHPKTDVYQKQRIFLPHPAPAVVTAPTAITQLTRGDEGYNSQLMRLPTPPPTTLLPSSPPLL